MHDSEPVERRVAILAVHGIGKHVAGETENAIANLLLSLPALEPDQPRSFETFRAVEIQMPLQRLEVSQAHRQTVAPVAGFKAKVANVVNVYQEQSTRFSEAASKFAATGAMAQPGKAGDGFTCLLLKDYRGGADGDAYITTRLEGRRHATSSKPAVGVDIYEVLWADLASPNSTFLSFFLALFQLLLHLGSLSLLAVDTGSAQNSGWMWQLYLAMQRYAVRMLQVFLPLFKLILLIVVFSCLPSLPLVAGHAGVLIPTGLFAVAGLAAGYLVLTRMDKLVTANPWLWSFAALVPAGAGAYLGSLLAKGTNAAEVSGAVACWIVIGGPLLGYVLSKYERVRHGVQITGWVAYALGLSAFLYLCYGRHVPVEKATFWLTEWVVAAIRTSWLLMFVFALVALVLGSLLWRRETDRVRRARLRAAVRTSRFALALPAALFLMITAMIWASLFRIAELARPKQPFFSQGVLRCEGRVTWLLHRLHLVPDLNHLFPYSTSNPALDYLKSLLIWSLGYQLPISLGLFSLGIFLLIWWAAPGALTERFPLRNQQIPPRNSTNRESLRLGRWISSGLDATSVVTFLFWCSVFLVPPLFFLLPEHFYASPGGWGPLPALRHATFWIVDNPMLIASGAVLAALVKYGSPVLGAVLDVDTYLRASPADATPRAKIAERFVSTLRYLARYRDATGRPYDSVVIVAHSLGTLITTDLLRYLYTHGDPGHEHPELALFGLAGDQRTGKVPLSLLTMGSPLRQLLNRFFPYLYDWVRDIPDNGLSPLPKPAEQPPDMNRVAPDPSELGIRQWVNTYRSGDYVGRSLWLDEWYNRNDRGPGQGLTSEPIYTAVNGLRVEECIGAGAHTHYWDDTAPDVARVLDQLILS